MPGDSIQARKQRMDELASLYLLGLLDHDDRHAFEEMLRQRDADALFAFRSFADAAAEYAGSYGRQRPPVALKSRLMERIRKTDQERSQSPSETRSNSRG
jgi:anti-sigma-K factor RskA